MKHSFLRIKLSSLLAATCLALAHIALAVDPTDTFYGTGAGANITNGIDHSGFGYNALYSNTTGSFNTTIGFGALASNTTGFGNTASGEAALASNTTGSDNTASGVSALELNTIGDSNTVSGAYALHFNTTGSYNTASGYLALIYNTTGSDNTATGYNALSNNTTGNRNTALGNNALLGNTTGGSNIAVGDSAGQLLTSGNNNIDIGNKGKADDNRVIRIGEIRTQKNAYIAGISGVTVAGGVGVVVDTNGHLGTITSSARYKEAIKPMEKTSEALLSLKPVTFHYKKELDPNAIPQFGLVAEDVAKVDPDLVARDDEGKPYTVRYEAVNAMLLNEFLKEHKKVEELEKQLQEVTARLDARGL